MAQIHSKLCPVCNSHDLQYFVTSTDHLVSKENFRIFKCSSCDFALTQDFPSEDCIGKYYDASDYVSHSDTQKGIVNRLYHLARKISLKSKCKLVSKTSGKDTGNLLDIGAGTGYFLNSISEQGWSVSGIEKSDAVRKSTFEKFGIVCSDSNGLYDQAASSQDVITMWHVLEHVEKLNETMDILHKILKSDGVILIALPNKGSCDALHYKGEWAAYDVPRHLWHFSITDFSLLAKKHGFEVIDIKPMHFDGFYISMLSEQNKGTFLAAIIGLIKGSFFFLRSLFNKKKSSSVIYILKKK